ncbi:Crp/Fnr family transcriptional regulator [soil metagenome]
MLAGINLSRRFGKSGISEMSDAVSTARLKMVPLFAGLPAEVIAYLHEASVARKYHDGHVLCTEGDPGETLYVLEEGEVRVSRMTEDGQEIVLAVVEAPNALGELSLLDGAPRTATVTAQGSVSIRLVPRTAFSRLLENEPAMVRAILARMAAMLRHTNQLTVDILTLDVPGRLAKWLLTRAGRHGGSVDEGISFALGRTQGELATELGTTRSTVNRALNSFEDLGLIQLDGDRVTLKDASGLERFTK